MPTMTRSDSDERLAQDPLTSRNGFSQDSLKVVSLPPPEKKDDSAGETMSSKKEVKSPPLAPVLENDEEPIRSHSAEASLEKMDVDCHGVVSVPETTTSAFLVEDGIGEELQRVKEASTAKVSEAGDDVHKMEEAVVCISEKKGQEDSDVQSLLEAERRSNDVDTKDQHQRVERVRVKDNAFVGRRSVNIDLVDDTALLNVVPFSKKAKEVAPRKHKNNGGRRIAGGGNATNAVEGKELRRRIVYSINEMKSMRYANSADQKKLWSDVYARMVPELVNEYEGLVSLRSQRTAKSYTRESGIGPVSAVPRRNRVNIFVH